MMYLLRRREDDARGRGIEVVFLPLYGWVVRYETTRERIAAFPYGHKIEAEARGALEAKRERCELTVKNMLGRISYKNSYGNDPRDIPG